MSMLHNAGAQDRGSDSFAYMKADGEFRIPSAPAMGQYEPRVPFVHRGR